MLVAVLLGVVLPATCAGQEQTPFDAEPEAAVPRRDDLERRRATMPTAPTQRVSISGGLLGTVQWIANDERARPSLLGAGSLDVNVIVRPAETVRLFMDAEGLIGPGPDQELGTLSRLNTDAERLEGRQKRLIIRELFLRMTWLDERVRFSIGKLDVGHYFDRNFFAEDETTQFLDQALINNPMLKPPPNGPGAAVRISVGDWRYALGVNAPDDVDGDLSGLPYIIGELGRRDIFPLRGHYRLWTRVSSVPEDRDRVTWGSGVSIDQPLTPEIGLFLRAGLSRSQGESLTSRAWSGGLSITPRWLHRPADQLGIGYTFQREPAGREELVETYYRATLAEWFSLVGNVQWLISGPNQVRGDRNRNVVIPGFRTLLLF